MTILKTNKIELSYVELPTKFVLQTGQRGWTPRKKGFCIGRIHHVTLGAGENFYLRTPLKFVKRTTSYEYIRVVDGVQYLTLKEACHARDLLDDDKDCVDAIIEATFRESRQYLRNLFYILPLSFSLTKPEALSDKT